MEMDIYVLKPVDANCAVGTHIAAEADARVVKDLGELVCGNDVNNDFMVKLPYKDCKGNTQYVHIRPQDAATMRAAAEYALQHNPPNNLQVFRCESSIWGKGQAYMMGWLDPKLVAEALKGYK